MIAQIQKSVEEILEYSESCTTVSHTTGEPEGKKVLAAVIPTPIIDIEIRKKLVPGLEYYEE